MDGARDALLAIAALGALVAAGCGEERMSLEEFTSSIEEQGVEIELGNELITDDSSKELRSIRLVPLDPMASPPTTGSLAVYSDTAAADRGLNTCKEAADLLCYQAGNVVVILEHGGIEAERLAVAMRQLAE